MHLSRVLEKYKKSSGFERIPKTTKPLSRMAQKDVLQLIERLEEDDDVQNVYHTLEIKE